MYLLGFSIQSRVSDVHLPTNYIQTIVKYTGPWDILALFSSNACPPTASIVPSNAPSPPVNDELELTIVSSATPAAGTLILPLPTAPGAVETPSPASIELANDSNSVLLDPQPAFVRVCPSAVPSILDLVRSMIRTEVGQKVHRLKIFASRNTDVVVLSSFLKLFPYRNTVVLLLLHLYLHHPVSPVLTRHFTIMMMMVIRKVQRRSPI